jgi:hypothetical protein
MCPIRCILRFVVRLCIPSLQINNLTHDDFVTHPNLARHKLKRLTICNRVHRTICVGNALAIKARSPNELLFQWRAPAEPGC